MALIQNPNDPQNMFSKAGKITSEKFIIFSRQKPQRIQSARTIIKQEQPEISAQQLKTQQPFTKQLSRAVNNYIQVGMDGQPPCGYYNPKFNQLDKAQHKVPDYDKTLMKTQARKSMGRVQSAINLGIVDKPRQKRDSFVDMGRQTGRKEIFYGQPIPHEERFNFLNVTTQFSKVPRTPQYSMDKSLSRDQMTVYKRQHFAPDYKPNFEFGRKRLGSPGPKFDSKKGRDDIMTKKSDYTFEEYYEYDTYSRSPNSQIYKQPTVPNFQKMIDRDHDVHQLPAYMQNLNTQNRMGISHLSQRTLLHNNFSEGRFQTVTSSFVPPQKKQKQQVQ